jgi:hypothetical protein
VEPAKIGGSEGKNDVKTIAARARLGYADRAELAKREILVLQRKTRGVSVVT